MPEQKVVVAECVEKIKTLFPDVPDDFRWNGQTFEQRIEGWILYAIQELDTETAGEDAETWDESEDEDGDFEWEDEDDEWSNPFADEPNDDDTGSSPGL